MQEAVIANAMKFKMTALQIDIDNNSDKDFGNKLRTI